MRSAVVSHRIRSRWITVVQPNGLLYFELNRNGGLIRPTLPRFVPCDPSQPTTTLPMPVSHLPISVPGFDTNWGWAEVAESEPETFPGFEEDSISECGIKGMSIS
jgi:hypothetical protein